MLFDRKEPSDGHWIGGDKVAALGDGKIKVRSLYCEAAQDAFAYKSRVAPKADRDPDGQIKRSVSARMAREVMAECCIIDADNLPYTAEQIREMLADPGYENLHLACLSACEAALILDAPAVEEKAERKKAVSKN